MTDLQKANPDLVFDTLRPRFVDEENREAKQKDGITCKRCYNVVEHIESGLCATCFTFRREVLPDVFFGELKDLKHTEENAKAINAAQGFVDGNARALYLYSLPEKDGTKSGCGTGKTMIAAAIGTQLFNAKKDVLFVNFGLFVRSCAPHNVLATRYASTDQIRKICGYKYLILNDICTRLTDEEIILLYDILEERELSARPKIIFTSNHPLQAIERKDDRVASRIAGFCGSEGFIDVPGEDGRLAK